MKVHPARIAAVAALVGAALAAGGAFLTWFRIEIGGVVGPGGEETGWDGRDGKTVVAGAVLAAVAALLAAIPWREGVAKVVLLVTGGVSAVVAVAGIVDASSKAAQVEAEFALAPGRVLAEVGPGLWLVGVAGIVELAAAVVLHRSAQLSALSGGPLGPVPAERRRVRSQP